MLLSEFFSGKKKNENDGFLNVVFQSELNAIMESLEGGFASPSVGIPVVSADDLGLHVRSQLASPLTMTFDPNLMPPPDSHVVLFNDAVSQWRYVRL